MVYPVNVGSGRVVGRFIFGVVDGPDDNEEPDFIRATGTVTFTPSVPYMPNATDVNGPVTIVPTAITAILDEDGYLCTPKPEAPDQAGYRGVRLFATDDEDLMVKDWSWNVRYKLTATGGFVADIPAHGIAVPEDGTVDLTTVVKVPATKGYGLPQAEAAAIRAEAAALVAGDAAQSVLSRADSGEFKGADGQDGSNVIPTGEAIKTAIAPGGEAYTVLASTVNDSFAAVRQAPLARNMPTKQVPQAETPGVWLNDLSDLSQITCSPGSTVQEIESTLPDRGRVLRVTLDAGSTYTQVKIPVQADLSNRYVSFMVKAGEDFQRMAASYSVGDETHNKRYEYGNALQTERLTGQWTQVSSPLARALPKGSATGAISERRDIQGVRLEIHSSEPDTPTVVDLSGIKAHEIPFSGVVIMFDDGWLSTYETAAPIMKTLGLTGNIAAIGAWSSEPVKPDYMSTAQIQEMYKAGWGIANHTWRHGGLDGMPPAEAEASIADGRDYLMDNGMPDDAAHLVYPGGRWNMAVLEMCKRQNVSTSRVVGHLAIVAPGIENRLLIQPWYATKNATVPQFTAALDRMQAYGGIMYLTFHNIADVADGHLETVLTPDFTAMMQAIADRGISTYRPSEVWP